jgi:adenylylsulfate kinase
MDIDNTIVIEIGRRALRTNQPIVFWFTGLSGSGKTTLAKWVSAHLRAANLPVEELDGDLVRKLLPQTGFSRQDRERHIQSMGYLAGRLESHGIYIVASFISPYRASRDFVRSQCRNFTEIYLSTPIEECERRDTKGLYLKARAGVVKSFTGIDDPYEPPLHSEVVIDTTNLSITEAGRFIFACLDCRLPPRNFR